MIQYFVKYSLNGQSSLINYTAAVDVNPGSSAANSFSLIAHEVVKHHNRSLQNRISVYDVVIMCLTKLN